MRSWRTCDCPPGMHLLPHHQPDRAQLRGGAPPHQRHLALHSERSAVKLVFAALICCSERSSRVSITDIERHELLREELRIDPRRRWKRVRDDRGA